MKQKFWNREVVRAALVVLASRIALLAAAYFFYLLREPGGSLSLFKEWMMQTGDVPHYLRLAEYGYTVGGEYENLMVFYPLFPWAIRLLRLVFRDYFISGLILSNVSAVLGCCVFYKLIRLDHPASVARDTLAFLLLYPFSFFMSFCYTESLFLLLCFLCIYYARKQQWILCGIVGMLAALCRTQGVILFGVAAYEYLLSAGQPIRSRTSGVKEYVKKLSPRGAAILLIPAGLGVYLGMNKVMFGNWFQFVEFQKAPPWYQSSGFFVNNLQQQMEMAEQYPQLAYVIYIPQILAFFAAFLLIFVGIRYKVRTSYLLYIAAYTMASYLCAWLISGGRYMLSCFMMFLPLALLAGNRIRRAVLLALGGGLFLFMFYAYMMGHAIM